MQVKFPMNVGYIYLIKNLINNKLYVGQSLRIDALSKKSYFGGGVTIKNAIVKYGKSNFKKTILLDNVPDNLLDEKESFYIKKYRTLYGKRMLYNHSDGGEGGYSYKCTLKLFKTRSGENAPIYGKTAIRNIKTNRLKYVSPNKVKSYLNRDWEIGGRKHTKEFKKMIGETLKNRVWMHNESHEHRMIKYEEISLHESLGWKVGRDETVRENMSKPRTITHSVPKGKESYVYGTKSVRNPSTNEVRRIIATKIESYLLSGWVNGRKYVAPKVFKGSVKNRKYMYNPTTQQTTRVKPENIDTYLSQGFKFGFSDKAKTNMSTNRSKRGPYVKH